MLASLSWLNEFVAIDDLDAERVAECLTQAGIEVEAIVREGTGIAAGDAVLEISITPNRGDCLSIHGLARDLAASLGRPLRRPRVVDSGSVPSSWKLHVFPEEGAIAKGQRGGSIDTPSRALAGDVSITIEDTRCGRYAAARIDGVHVVPSPPWLQDRLTAHGLRPVNAIVDVTNLMLLENGQPLHAFDLDRLAGPAIHVRAARAGEKLVGIDGTEMTLDPDDLVIADAEKPVALAGVMGGRNSEIGEETTSILLECASFDASSVRRSARRYGLHTDSSHRFERGVDPLGVSEALRAVVDRILSVLCELGQEPRLHPIACEQIAAEPVAGTIAFDPRQVARHIGLHLETETMRAALRALGFAVEEAGESWQVGVPSWRSDIQRPIDLVEEIVRIVGYDRIPSELPPVRAGRLIERRSAPPVPQQAQPVVPRETLERVERVRDTLCAAGCHEAVNLSMVSPESQRLLLGEGAGLRLRNPLGEETSALRTTLLAGLLTNVAHNRAQGAERVALFELGSVFPEPSRDGAPERLHLAVVLSGIRHAGWQGRDPEVDAFDMASLFDAVVEAAEAHAGRETIAHEAAVPPWLHPGVRAGLRLRGGQSIVGWLGQVHPDLLRAWDIDGDVFAMEFDLSALLDVHRPIPRAQALPRFPAATRDVALLLDADCSAQHLIETSSAWAHDFLQDVRVFDVYQGKGIPPGRQSVALRLTFRNPEASLTEAEIEALETGWLDHMVTALGAERR